MAEQIVDIIEANMPASSDVVAAARSAAGAVALDALSGKVDKTGVGQVSMQNLSQEVKEALTGGSVAVVGVNSVGYGQLDTPRQMANERIANKLTIGSVDNKAWLPNESGTIIYQAAKGWSGLTSDLTEFVVKVDSLATFGDTPGIQFVDSDLKLLASFCLGPEDYNVHEWSDVRCTAPPGTAHMLVNAYRADENPAELTLLVWSAESTARRITGDYGNITDFEDGLIAGIDSLSTYYGGQWSYEELGFITSDAAINGGLITPPLSSVSSMVFIHVKGEAEKLTAQILVREIGSSGETFRELLRIGSGPFDVWTQYDANSASIYDGMTSFQVFVQGTDQPGSCRIDEFEVCEKTVDGFRGNTLYRPRLSDQFAAVFDRLDRAGTDEGTSVAAPVFVSPDGTRWSLTVSDEGVVGAVSHTPSSVLFMGNSLLLGFGAFGMCASSQQTDYAWNVEQAIKAKDPNCAFDKLHDAAFEQAETDQAAQEYITTNQNRWSGKDLVILQIGDNANTDTRRQTFARNLPGLLASIRAGSPNARVLLVGIWFTNDTNVRTMQDAAKAYGCELVRIDDLNVKTNQAVEGQLITYPDGDTESAHAEWVTHPGDQGMQAIAERIIQTLDM